MLDNVKGSFGCPLSIFEVIMKEIFTRTEKLFGEAGMKKLENAHVAVFGAGGVGGYVVEALVRSGVGHIDVIDKDVVDITNINRQIIATMDTIGQDKTDVICARARSINPDIDIKGIKCFFLPDTAQQFDFTIYDYVVDAIDNVTAKIELVMRCRESNTPIIASMGTGNKLDPSKLEITDIYKTSVCPLARVMRQELRKRQVARLDVLFSTETPIHSENEPRTPGSTAFVPSSAGLLIASYVVRQLLKKG